MPNNATASGYEHLDTDKMRTFSYFAGIRELQSMCVDNFEFSFYPAPNRGSISPRSYPEFLFPLAPRL